MEYDGITFRNTSSGVWRGCCPKRISKRHVGKEKHCSVSVSMLCNRPMTLRLSCCHVATPPGGMNMRPPKGGLSKTMSFSSWNKSILNKSRVLSIADSNNSSSPKKGMYQVFSPTGCHRLHPQGQDLQSGPHSFVDLYSHEQILCFGDFFKPTKILFGDQTWQ